MRILFSKLISLTLVGLALTSTSFGASAEDKTSAPTAGLISLPPIDLEFLNSYLPPAGDSGLNIRLHRISVIEADIYGAIAAELSYVAARERDGFYVLNRSEKPLSKGYLESIGDPALGLFAGWKVVNILDTIPAPGEGSIADMTQTDLFALTLESADGYKITSVRGTDSQSLHNILMDLALASHHDVPTLGTTFAQKNHPLAFLGAGIAAHFIPKPLREMASGYATTATTAMGHAGSVATQHAKPKLQKSVEEVDLFLRRNMPDMVVGHSLGGILVNSILRARKLLGGDGAEMEHGIKYIGNFAGMGTHMLIPEIAKILDHAASPVSNSALIGRDLERYREFFRHSDAVGSSGKHIGTCIALGHCLPDATLGIAPVSTSPADAAVAATDADTAPLETEVGSAQTMATLAVEPHADVMPEVTTPSSVLSGIFSTAKYFASETLAMGGAAASYTSGALTTAVSATGNTVRYFGTLASQPAKDLLAAHNCRSMMRELLMAYAFQKAQS
jgi:hypothetical protein